MRASDLFETWTSNSIFCNPRSLDLWQPLDNILPLTWASTSAGISYMAKEGRQWRHTFAISGLRKEWLKIELKEGRLYIAYEPPKEHSDIKSDTFTRWENWREGLYTTDKSIQPQDIKAQYRNGILLISCDAPDRSAPASQIPVTE